MTPEFLYGTAWKEDETARLVRLALEQGFRGIDTANQRKHYFEAAVGEAVNAAIQDGLVTLDELWLQTKFTHRGGQDHRLPYDADADPATQVRQSYASSLEHLPKIDSYVLHGPSAWEGWPEEDRLVWKAMEEVHPGVLGVSNVTLEQLEKLCDWAERKPTYVQNRCYARQGWDAKVRRFCREHGLIYQGFSLLTANKDELKRLQHIARRHQCTPAQVVFRFAQQVGMLPLTGTKDPQHMREDLAVSSFSLTPEQLAEVEKISL